MDRRTFLQATATTAAALAIPEIDRADDKELDPIFAQIAKQHDENVRY
jgi:TAT (twin-arginine translocation) pathway signal sequence